MLSPSLQLGYAFIKCFNSLILTMQNYSRHFKTHCTDKYCLGIDNLATLNTGMHEGILCD